MSIPRDITNGRSSHIQAMYFNLKKKIIWVNITFPEKPSTSHHEANTIALMSSNRLDMCCHDIVRKWSEML